MEEIFEIIFGVIILVIVGIPMLAIYFWPFLLPVFIISLIRKNASNKKFKSNVIRHEEKKVYQDVDATKLAEFDVTDITILKNYLFDIFTNFEQAYNALDYNGMYNNSTEKLYNSYHTNIMLNLKFAQKKIIENIKRKNVIIYDTLVTTRKQLIQTMIEIEYISYTEDHSGKIISGSPKPITEKFEVIFVKYYGENQNNKCPNCGASITGEKCEYCNTTFRNSDFKIDSIKKIIE